MDEMDKEDFFLAAVASGRGSVELMIDPIYILGLE